ncbi:sensor histidine kinase [Amycolatopsis sp. 195334CR]|uniref:sensor histidine kinase n=1 Tax=Amycolatopsis sp. 195334CR TaxID=2814588 RepID=UPI001A8C6CC4|nr:histidine kinase [Amycolatopsis sp. 195334CR]MBN6035209.1 two-component sensor histidine kinase [Amycolatopsis sp. 195334CR]
MRDITGSLARQAWLIAVVCMVSDGSIALMIGPPLTSWRAWAVLLATVAVDLALAGPARLSGLVALGHAVLYPLTPLLLNDLPGAEASNTAGMLIAGYRAGAWLSTLPAVASLLALITGSVIGELLERNLAGRDWRLLSAILLANTVLPWLVGRYTTERRARIAELERREEAAVRRAVAEERSSVARDLHDVISHHVSAIGMHAGAARLGLNGDTDTPVHRSLSAVETSSRAAMADLRRMLDLLHGEQAAVRQPGVGNLEELLEGTRAAGLPARLHTQGVPGELPGSVDVAVYRVAQEGLTNALRHGAGGPVDVKLCYRTEEITLSVTNPITPGRPSTADEGTRRGLAGLRQRVAMFGGEFSSGPSDDGRSWLVSATFPLESS